MGAVAVGDVADPVFLDIEEAVGFFSGKLSKSTIYKWALSGQIPSRKLGGKRLFVKQELAAWDASRAQSVKREDSISRFQTVRERHLRSLKTEDAAVAPESRKGSGKRWR